MHHPSNASAPRHTNTPPRLAAGLPPVAAVARDATATVMFSVWFN